MNMLKKSFNKALYWENNGDITSIAELLNANHVGLGTTDTIPGFFAPLSHEGYQQLHNLKEERGKKPFLILTTLSKIDFFIDTAEINPGVLNIITHCFPAPLTLVLKARSSLPEWMVSAENTIAIRCPKHAGIETLLKSFEGVFSTSANRSNKPSPQNLNEVEETILQKVDFVVQSHKTNDTSIVHSTIVDCSHSTPLLLRAGAFSFNEVLHYYERAKNNSSLE